MGPLLAAATALDTWETPGAGTSDVLAVRLAADNRPPARCGARGRSRQVGVWSPAVTGKVTRGTEGRSGPRVSGQSWDDAAARQANLAGFDQARGGRCSADLRRHHGRGDHTSLSSTVDTGPQPLR